MSKYAGVGVFFKPKLFAYIISLWLLGIIEIPQIRTNLSSQPV